MIDAGPGSDLASSDCVWILFDNFDFYIRNISLTSINVGGMDEMRMGEGGEIANAPELLTYEYSPTKLV